MKRKILSTILTSLAWMLGFNAQAATGGPDGFGYTWIDSGEPNGPIYNWIEIATPAGGSGTLRTAVACDDCHEANIPLGFNFPFYGVNSNTISIGSNGVVYFENVYLGLANICMPGTPGYTMAQYKFIAHMWDDLAPNYQGGIYTQAFPNYFVIEYYDIVPCCATGDGDTWQVILFRNGNILMQYKELSFQGLQSDFTVGIQNNPTTGLQYKCDAAGIPLANNRAILFSPPSFSCGSVSQNVLGNPGFCTGSSVVLSAGGTSIAQTWSTGPTTPTITVNTIGTYSIYMLDTNGCTIRDTASVVENPLPVVNLGADVTQCGGAVVLDAGNAGMNYLWSDNSTAQMLSANTSGSYFVTVTNPLTTCAKNDTVSVTINPLPVVTLGSDVAQCEGSVTLDAGNSGMDYVWSDNSIAQTLIVNTSGSYFVNVTDPATLCTGTDTILVTINSNPVVALGADITQCGGSVILDAGNAGSNFMWNDMSTAQTLSVSASGTYDVMVTDPLTGCMNSDTIMVAINAIPVVVLGADITQCGGSATLDAGNAGSNFLWNDGTTTQTLSVNTSGPYYVMVTDPLTNCMSSDTIMVTINAQPTVAFGMDVIQCGGSVVLNAGNNGMSYLWNDNSTGQTLTVTATGTYYVTVTDSASTCSGSDTISIVINAVPTVTFTLATATVCVDDGSFALTGGSPAGGTYSGTGVSAGAFSPTTSGTGPHVITYTYVDQATGCVNSATQTIAVSACVGIAEQAADGILVYPNPTSGILNVEVPATESTIEVYNAVGELIESQQVNNGTAKIDFSTRENGIYFVRVSDGNTTRIEKIVVQH